MTDTATTGAPGEDYPELRESGRKICERYPPPYLRQLVTEPTTGSDTTKRKTRALRQGNHYVINGQKVWTSRARHSDLMLLLARTTPVDEVSRRTDGLSVFLVDLRENLGHGVEIRPIEAMINHNTTEVFFDNPEGPPENLIEQRCKGFRYILDGMNAERILVAQECVGAGRWLLRK